MKRFIILFLMLFGYIASYAQFVITTEGCELYRYSYRTNKYEFINNDDNEATMFEVNSNQTVIKHTTATMTSSYYIKDKEVPEEGMIKYEVLSDVGNEYTFIITKDFVLIYNQKSDPPYALAHHIKRMFKE